MELKKESQALTIRKAIDLDISTINKVLYASKSYWGYDEVFMSAFMEKFALSEKYLNDNSVYVASKNGKIIAFFSFIFREDGQLELDHFFISPKHIVKGYARKLWVA